MAYEPRAVRGLGWTLVVLGCLSVTLGVAADITFAAHDVGTLGHYISAPVWSGLLVLTTGILGIFSAKKPTNKCLIVAFMVVGIFVILACVCCIAIAALGIVLNHYVHSCRQYDWDGYYNAQDLHDSNPDLFQEPEVWVYEDIVALGIVLNQYVSIFRQYDWEGYYAAQDLHDSNPGQFYQPETWHYKTYDCRPAAIGLHAANIFLAVLELILGFVVSILSCCELCTMRRPAAQTVIYTAGPVPGGAQGNIVVMQGTPGVQGSQPQMFVAQNPGAAGAPVQVFYPAQQVPPAYQVDAGAASGAQEEKKGPIPVGSM